MRKIKKRKEENGKQKQLRVNEQKNPKLGRQRADQPTSKRQIRFLLFGLSFLSLGFFALLHSCLTFYFTLSSNFVLLGFFFYRGGFLGPIRVGLDYCSLLWLVLTGLDCSCGMPCRAGVGPKVGLGSLLQQSL